MTIDTREEIRAGQLAIRFLVDGKQSGGSVALFEFDVPAGAKVPIAHSHDGYEETIYGLAGVLTWTVDGERHEVGPGSMSATPPVPCTTTVAMMTAMANSSASQMSPRIVIIRLA